MDNNTIKLNQSQSVLLIGAVTPVILRQKFSVSNEDFFALADYTIAEIKKLIHFVNLKPYNSQKRVAVILMAEKLNLQAANAILKTLEEPPADALIILTTLNEQKILPTIISRCQKIRLSVEETQMPPSDYQDPGKIGQMAIAQRFQLAASIAEQENADKILTLHQEYFRQQLLGGKDVVGVLKRLALAKDLLGRNISVKLLLENLFLEYDHES